MVESGIALEAKSLGEQVAAALREAILSGRLSPGQALREATLAKDLGVARNTVREALRILAGERLVSYQLHHGAVVSSLTEADVVDLYGVRALLEPAAILDVANHRPETVQGVVSAVERLEEATRQSDLTTVVERDLDVHRALVALHGSPRLNDFFTDLCAQVRRCVLLVIYSHAEHQSSHNVDGHRVIANALVAGDYADAAELARHHVEETRDQALALIRHGSPTDAGAARAAESPSRQRSIPRRNRRSSTPST